MHLLTTIRVDVPGTAVLRAPSFWERLVSSLGGEVNLETDSRSLARDVLGLVEQVKDALSTVDLANATCLAIDSQVVFFDKRGQDRDMPALVDAVRASTDRFSRGFEKLRLVLEHVHGDLELLVEATFSSQFRKGCPAAELTVAARASSLRRAPSETQAEAKARLAAAHADPTYLRRQLEAFTVFARSIERCMTRSFPEATIAATEPKAFVLRPRASDLEELAEISLRGVSRTARHAPLLGPEGSWVVDPWDRYYKDLGYVWVDLELLDEMVVPNASTQPENVEKKAALEIVAPGGDSLGDEGSVSSHAQELMPVHRAAAHDFTEPDVRPVELRHYDEPQPNHRR